MTDENATTALESIRDQWRSIVSHSSLYALLFTGCLLIDAVVRTSFLGDVPHPIVYYLPSLAAAAVLSLVARQSGLSAWVDDRFTTSMAVYAALTPVVGVALVLG